MLEYTKLLNPSQLEAVSLGDDNALVVAGAGTGKTRTIVYRLAWLIEHGLSPKSMLLLTFTRKAAKEMLYRAGRLLGPQMGGIGGGTFHSFAAHTLRIHPPRWLGESTFTVLDPSETSEILRRCRKELGLTDRYFSDAAKIQGLFSRVRNRDMSIGEYVENREPALLAFKDDLEALAAAFSDKKRELCVLDYDDLLFELEAVLSEDARARAGLNARFRHILIDEYQDTNPVQGRIAKLLAGNGSHVMAVGDEAQSIYSFRGATVRNILDFPDIFPSTHIVRLERNYRSTGYVLDLANDILSKSKESYGKHLFTAREDGSQVRLIRPKNSVTQAEIVADRICELLAVYPANEIAVLFRAAYESSLLEVELRRRKIDFRKFGGLKYSESAHVKDVLSYVRLLNSRSDTFAFSRFAKLFSGIGPKTAEKLYYFVALKDEKNMAKARKKHPELFADLDFIDSLESKKNDVSDVVKAICDHCEEGIRKRYPEDWAVRLAGLAEMPVIAFGYDNLSDFVSDFLLEASQDDTGGEGKVVLSTIHSAKGLEWKAVLLLDLVDERLPSAFALDGGAAGMEEERRLFYVACTRAKDILELYAPKAVMTWSGGLMPTNDSQFLSELDDLCYDSCYEQADSSVCVVRWGRQRPLCLGGDCGRPGASPCRCAKGLPKAPEPAVSQPVPQAASLRGAETPASDQEAPPWQDWEIEAAACADAMFEGGAYPRYQEEACPSTTYPRYQEAEQPAPSADSVAGGVLTPADACAGISSSPGQGPASSEQAGEAGAGSDASLEQEEACPSTTYPRYQDAEQPAPPADSVAGGDLPPADACADTSPSPEQGPAAQEQAEEAEGGSDSSDDAAECPPQEQGAEAEQAFADPLPTDFDEVAGLVEPEVDLAVSAPVGPDDASPWVQAQEHLSDIDAGKAVECMHRMFGTGRVVGFFRRDGDDPIVRVIFDNCGEKTVLSSFLLVRLSCPR